MKRKTAAWVRKAEADFVAANRLSRGKAPLHDIVCFHCQATAEKYLKALMEEVGLTVPKTHALKYLLDCLLPHHPSLKSLERGLLFLTGFAVETRYLERNATKREAVSAQKWASRVRTA